MDDLYLSTSVREMKRIAHNMNVCSNTLRSFEEWLGAKMDWNEAHQLAGIRKCLEEIRDTNLLRIENLQTRLIAEGIRNSKGDKGVENK